MASTDKARVLLVGAGGVGAMACYALESGGGAEVTAVLRSNYDVVEREGFSIDSIEHGKGIKGFRPSKIRKSVPNVTDEDLPPFDYIVVTTKNILDVRPNVLDLIEAAVTPGVSAIVLLQNGLNIELPIIERFPDNTVLSGVSIISASEPEKGHIVHEFTDTSKVGPFPSLKVPSSESVAAAKWFVELYNRCGRVNCQFDEDVSFTRWRKLVYNSSFNSVSAILNMGVVRMRMTRHVVDDLIKPIMAEIFATAKAAGVTLPEGLDMQMIRLDPPDEDFLPSMGQDAAKGNYMEVEVIVGAPLREAERLGVATPTLKTIYGLLRGLQVKAKERKGAWKAEFEEDNPYY
ncbi:uncharacterized protein LTR77_000645 [Saxophila tyrrhenica]|uniref:2-dehydropantoate 2-reductase n=1 Tax=Saxophila tyrrhenica TaxID=1690608 RepID=A0AAV9PP52_9PEZI|nr:hypothetical protein LTR77_000645 [Saxophila tyrrhenica]